MIKVHIIFDVKQDGRRKARLVAGGHLTGPNMDTYYSSVVSLRSMRMVIFLSELNDLELCAGDIGNAYLEAYTNEKVCFIGGKEFAPYGHEGHLLVIEKALYDLTNLASNLFNLVNNLSAIRIILSIFSPQKAEYTDKDLSEVFSSILNASMCSKCEFLSSSLVKFSNLYNAMTLLALKVVVRDI